MPGVNLKIVALALLMVVFIGQIPLEAVSFSPELVEFIRDGKEVKVLVAETEKEISLIPLKSARLYRTDDAGYLDLEEGKTILFDWRR